MVVCGLDVGYFLFCSCDSLVTNHMNLDIMIWVSILIAALTFVVVVEIFAPDSQPYDEFQHLRKCVVVKTILEEAIQPVVFSSNYDIAQQVEAKLNQLLQQREITLADIDSFTLMNRSLKQPSVQVSRTGKRVIFTFPDKSIETGILQ